MCPHAVVRTQLQIRAVGAANKQDLGRWVFSGELCWRGEDQYWASSVLIVSEVGTQACSLEELALLPVALRMTKKSEGGIKHWRACAPTAETPKRSVDQPGWFRSAANLRAFPLVQQGRSRPHSNPGYRRH